jgi:hypothetical protein
VAEFTRPATWEDVKHLARYLEEARVEYALIGGYALAAHGLVRLTEDIELEGVRLRVLSLEGLLKTKSGARPKDQLDAAAIARALEQLGRRP